MNEHVPIEMLARLAEGHADEPEAAEVREHLATCRACMAAYADAVRYRAAWIATPQEFHPERTATDGTTRDRRSTSQGFRQAALAAGMVIALGGVALLVGRGLLPKSDAEVVPTVIREALEAASANGLVLPGGEAAANLEVPVTRAGAPGRLRHLESQVEEEIRRYEAGDRSSDRTFLVVAGLLGLQELQAAQDYVEEGLERHPDDPRLLILAADIARRGSRLAQAEGHLRHALALEPKSRTASLDLALVLLDMERMDEARVRLGALSDGQSEIAARAREELDAMERAHP